MRTWIPSRLAAVALAAAAAVSVSACNGLQFEQDRRLTFTSPRANALTTAPLTVTWSMTDYPTAPGQDEFAVFVDKAPIKVGQDLRSIVPARTPDAGVPALLNSLQVYATPDSSVTVTNIRDIANNTAKRQTHTVTVILVDGSGRRTSESAWTRTFDLHALGNGSSS